MSGLVIWACGWYGLTAFIGAESPIIKQGLGTPALDSLLLALFAGVLFLAGPLYLLRYSYSITIGGDTSQVSLLFGGKRIGYRNNELRPRERWTLGTLRSTVVEFPDRTPLVFTDWRDSAREVTAHLTSESHTPIRE